MDLKLKNKVAVITGPAAMIRLAVPAGTLTSP